MLCSGLTKIPFVFKGLSLSFCVCPWWFLCCNDHQSSRPLSVGLVFQKSFFSFLPCWNLCFFGGFFWSPLSISIRSLTLTHFTCLFVSLFSSKTESYLRKAIRPLYLLFYLNRWACVQTLWDSPGPLIELDTYEVLKKCLEEVLTF